MTQAAGTWNGVARQSQVACRRFIALGDGTGDCATEDRAADALVAVNDRVARYFATLAAVAVDENYSISGGAENLSGAVAQIPGVNADDVAAVGELATAFANLMLQHKRERSMRRLIERGGQPAQRVIAMMRRVAVPSFAGNLDSEAQRIDQALIDTIPDPMKRLGPDRRAWCDSPPRLSSFGRDRTAFLMALELCRRHREVRGDQAAVAAYDASLASAAEALGQLQSGAARLGKVETARLLYQRARDLQDKIDAVRARRTKGDE
ncbi:MAG: hypothetical protein V4537_16715 [Pseudomonadota bacterium]